MITKQKKILGDFLNVETFNYEVRVWYFDNKDKTIKFKYREDIELFEVFN